MTVSLKYHEILEENFVLDLEWLKEEFELLFKSKTQKHTKIDKRIANNILDYVLENTDVNGNIRLHNLLDEVLKDIEKNYKPLFNGS